VRVPPPTYISGALTLVHDPVCGRPLRSINASVGLRFTGGGATTPVTRIPLAGNEAQTAPPSDPLVPWSASLSYSYGGSRGGTGDAWSTRQAANAVLNIKPTRNWELHYDNTIDVSAGKVVAQEYALSRTLHCWNLQFVRRFIGGTSDYYFRIGIIDRPEVYLDRGTSGIGAGGYNSLPGLGSLGY
jgi:hypothetical protein